MEPGIVIFGGTTEGRRLAEWLAATNARVYACVATEYGGTLIKEAENIQVLEGRMDAEQMQAFFLEHHIEYCLDATHPYAVLVTENIQESCKRLSIPYVRVYREEQEAQGRVVYCDSVEAAVEYLSNTLGRILITTGSKELEKYTKIPEYKNRCVVRVLPTLAVMEKCEQLGFVGKNVIGMQGPFHCEMNVALLKQTGASYLVTKNSGKEGGFSEKCEAAKECGVTLVVIGRPEEETEGISLCQVIKKVLGDCDLKVNRRFTLIGMGPGDWKYLTLRAVEAVEESDVLIGARRVVEIYPNASGKPQFYSYKKKEILEFLDAHPEYVKIGLLYSGDITMYSGAKEWEQAIQGVCGISSVSYFLSRVGLSYAQVELCSCHGADPNLIEQIRTKHYVVALVGSKDFLRRVAERLAFYDMKQVRITAGERLSYEDMKLSVWSVEEACSVEIDQLSLVLFENPAYDSNPAAYLKDASFLRGDVPMTKEEIRILSVEQLGVKCDSVCYDIGAGTGSVAIQLARKCPQGKVYGIEKNPKAISLLEENKKRLCAENLELIFGAAPEVLEDLPMPTHVFVGGSSGQLLEIVEAVRKKNKAAKFVLNAITLETIGQVMEVLSKYPEYQNGQIMSVQISKSKRLGEYHLMEARNLIYIIQFGGE